MRIALYILLFWAISFVWFCCGMIYLLPRSKHYNKPTLWNTIKELLILGPFSIIIALISDKQK